MIALVLVAERAAFAGMRVEAGDGEPRRRDARTGARARRRRSSPVSTISSVVSAAGTSASGMWMVTGTARIGAGEHHHRRRAPSSGEVRENSVWPGWRSRRRIERLLVDRIGDDARAPRPPRTIADARGR